MTLLPLSELGARETSPGILEFGLYLPGVTSAGGFSIRVKVIHEQDQFLQAIPPLSFELANTASASFAGGDYWSVRVDTTRPPVGTALPAGARWGQPGRYVYRYAVSKPGGGEIDFVVDPYAREYGVGDLSAITVGFKDHPWSDNEARWRVPPLQDLIGYELQLEEFGGGIDGTIALMDYLQDLQVNCLEVMPVNNVKNSVNWGYDPFGYFGVDERFGKRDQFQRFVDEAHQRGMAVILDVVYGHTTGDFTFPYLYPQIGVANPFNGPQIRDRGYGPVPDFSQRFTQDYFFTANQIWLDKFHVDGFRYDNVPAFWDPQRPQEQYGALVKETYRLVERSITAGAGPVNYWKRFDGADGTVQLIQCAEYLDDPPAVLNNTFTNCTWQDWTLAAAKECARGDGGAITDLGLRLGLEFFPTVQTVDGVTLPRTAFQYIENHDHSRFICEFGLDKRDDMLLWKGLDSNWFKLQPYLIGLLTAKGIPMLWEGGEFLQTFFVPDMGNGRQLVYRPVDFSNFYSTPGRSLVSLVRRLIQIRNEGAQFRRGDHTFFNVDFYNNQGLLLFSRSLGRVFSLVALNFTGSDRSTTIEFPVSGSYREEINGRNNLSGVTAGANTPVTIPSNYGQIWTIR